MALRDICRSLYSGRPRLSKTQQGVTAETHTPEELSATVLTFTLDSFLSTFPSVLERENGDGGDSGWVVEKKKWSQVRRLVSPFF